MASVKVVKRGIVFFSIAITILSCAASYGGLKFKNPENVSNDGYYVMTKDGVKHSYSNIDGFELMKRNKFLLSATESYRSEDVVGYKTIYKRYGGDRNWVSECKKIEGHFSNKIVTGRINVYNTVYGADGGSTKQITVSKYYVEKGEGTIPVMLIPQSARGEIYEMLKDYEPSRAVMDDYLKAHKIISLKLVVEAINLYNNR